jgi:hypothetical protein
MTGLLKDEDSVRLLFGNCKSSLQITFAKGVSSILGMLDVTPAS